MAESESKSERTERLSVPVTPEEKQEFRVRAAKEGKSMSELARRVLFESECAVQTA